MDPLLKDFKCICGAFYAGDLCEKFNASIFICAKLGLCNPLGPYLFGFSVFASIGILVVVAQGCLLMFRKLLHCKGCRMEVIEGTGKRKRRQRNNTCFVTQTGSQGDNLTTTQDLCKNIIGKRISNSGRRIHLTDSEKAGCVKKMKPKRKCLLCSQLEAPLSYKDTGNDIGNVKLSSVNTDPCLPDLQVSKNNAEIKQNMSHHQTEPVSRANYSKNLIKPNLVIHSGKGKSKSTNPYSNDSSVSSDDLKTISKLEKFKWNKLNKNEGYDDDDDDGDDNQNATGDNINSSSAKGADNITQTNLKARNILNTSIQNNSISQCLASCSNKPPESKIFRKHVCIFHDCKSDSSCFRNFVKIGRKKLCPRQRCYTHKSIMKAINYPVFHTNTSSYSPGSLTVATKSTTTKTTTSLVYNNGMTQTILQPLNIQQNFIHCENHIKTPSPCFISQSCCKDNNEKDDSSDCMEYENSCNHHQTFYLA
uniref:EGF-like domain-containing protein n=1 Tax=Trichobilharzia regenti TaxID=157069 RepID=A0AA85KHR7_TRIRE|nr:unnamed protein product [Trichobilharzia regenti]